MPAAARPRRSSASRLHTAFAGGIAALVAGGAASTAHADRFEATRSELLVEREHDITMTLGYGHAELVVRRTVFNGGDRHDQAMWWVDVPDGGVAVRLRTLAMLNGKPHWYEGELLEAELAAARYRELTGIGGYYPKDPALLSWRSQSELALQVFPCPPRQLKSVEYTMLMPATYTEGRYAIELPELGTEDMHATIEVRGASRGDQVFVDDLPVGRSERVEMGASHRFAVARADAPLFDGAVAMVPVSDDRALFHYEVEASRALSRVPEHADVVVLIDRSRSISEDDRRAEVALARAYLGHFDEPGLDARAAIVAFDRTAEDMLGGLVPVREANAWLERAELGAKNGSHVDLAFDRATALFAASKGKRARRIVLLGDRRSRSALSEARLAAFARRSGAVVHVVTASLGENALEREDGATWSNVARDTGGVAWSASVSVDDGDPSARGRVFEELARPMRLHHLEVVAPGVSADDLDAPDELVEGEAATATLFADRTVPHVLLTGELWAEPVRKVFTASADESKRQAALVLGSELLDSLSEPEIMVLAQRGRAVSPVTSYLAIEPGVRPSTEGLLEGEGIGSAFGVGNLGLVGTGSGGGGASVVVDLQKLMTDHVRAAAKQCAAPHVTAALETTLDEVVDVVEVEVHGDAVATDCMREAIWAFELPPSFRAEHDTWRVVL